MDQKDFTRIGTIRAVDRMFTNVADDDHALFIFETMDEFPEDQMVGAIDLNGAVPNAMYHGVSLKLFSDQLKYMVEREAESAELNHVARSFHK